MCVIHTLHVHINHHPFHTCAYCTFSVFPVLLDFHIVAENLHDSSKERRKGSNLTRGPLRSCRRPLCRRCHRLEEVGYGGRLPWRMWFGIVKNVISKRGWANPHNKFGCPINPYCYENLLKTGDWTSSDLLRHWPCAQEVKALRENTAASTTRFLYEYIWCRYGCPIELNNDQGGHFLGQVVKSPTTR